MTGHDDRWAYFLAGFVNGVVFAAVVGVVAMCAGGGL